MDAPFGPVYAFIPSKYERFPPSSSHTLARPRPRPFLARPRPFLARSSPGLARPHLALTRPRFKQSSRHNGPKRNFLAPPVALLRNPEKGAFAEEGCAKLSQICREFESQFWTIFCKYPFSNAPFSKFLTLQGVATPPSRCKPSVNPNLASLSGSRPLSLFSWRLPRKNGLKTCAYFSLGIARKSEPRRPRPGADATRPPCRAPGCSYTPIAALSAVSRVSQVRRSYTLGHF